MSQTPHAIAADHQTPTIGTAWSVEEGATRARHLFGGHIGGSPDGVWAAPGRVNIIGCLLYTSPSPRDQRGSRMPSSA